MFGHFFQRTIKSSTIFVLILISSQILIGCDTAREAQAEKSENKPTQTPVPDESFLRVSFDDNPNNPRKPVKVYELSPTLGGNDVWVINENEIGLKKVSTDEKLIFTVDVGDQYQIGQFGLRTSDGGCDLPGVKGPGYQLEIYYSDFWSINCGPQRKNTGSQILSSNGGINVIF